MLPHLPPWNCHDFPMLSLEMRLKLRPGMDLVHTNGRARGFSLVELLVVIGIMVVLGAMAVPSIQGIAGTAGRKGAVNVLLNTFEQARAAALESGANTYVGFADRNFPLESLRYRAFIVFRDRTEDDLPAAGAPGAPQFVPLTAWETLPKPVSLKSERLSLVEDVYIDLADASLPRLAAGARLPAAVFTPSGALSAQHDKDRLRLFLYEGHFLNNQDNFIRQRSFHQSSAGLFDRISFSRFTGRARLDVATAQ